MMAVVILMRAAGAFVFVVKHTDSVPALKTLHSDLATQNSTEMKKKQ